MANVNIKFNNKDYLLSCDDGQEENLKKLANHLDSKYNKLKNNLGNIGENKLLLITAIQMVDDYFDLFKKVENTKSDFEKLSIRFKELKLLAIQYKDEKDVEIQKLKNEVDDFKKMVEKSKNSYEEILDKTTKSIEKFIENAEVDQEKNIQ
jgi:cell division protein ZapA|tara:strand:+ start:371 stop:823 length:453 start_codon:yes stop_codon:yes gene_type:complete